MKYYTHLLEGKLLEMCELGRFDEYKVLIYGSEGPVPHLHFQSTKGGKKGCVRLDKPEYFIHGKYKDRLNSKELKQFIEFLKSPHRLLGKAGISNWQMIIVYWGDNNPDYRLDIDTQMPDYTQLNN